MSDTSYTIAINGQQAVDAGYKFCNGMCYRSVEGIGQLEVVIDFDGIYNGRPNKWVTVSFIEKESNIPRVLECLKELGFAGCEAFISLSTYDGCFCTDKDLYYTVIGEENIINIINAASNDTKEFTVSIGTGLAWTEQFKVYATNEQEAVDLVADYIEEQRIEGLYADHYGIAGTIELMGASEYQTVDDYAEANGLVCCGNHGIYLQILNIEEVNK